MDTRSLKTSLHDLLRRLAILLLVAGLLPLSMAAVVASSRGATPDPRKDAQIRPSVSVLPGAIPALGRAGVPDGLSAAGVRTVTAGQTAIAVRAPAASGGAPSIWMALAALAAGPLIVTGALVRERRKHAVRRRRGFAVQPSLQNT